MLTNIIRLYEYKNVSNTTGKAIGSTPGEYKDFLYEPNVSLDANGTLHFKKITKEAQGHFLCEAKNNIGTGVSKVIFLKVNGNFEKCLSNNDLVKLHLHIQYIVN